MPDVSFGNLLAVAAIAVLAPLVTGFLPRLRIPSVVLLLAIALSATSLGLVVPVLKDAGQVNSEVGQAVIAAASVADFAAIVLLSLFFSTSGGSTGSKVVLLVTFAALVAVTGVAVASAGRSMRLGEVLSGCRTPRRRSGCASRSCCWWRSRQWPSGSGSRASWARSWPEPSAVPAPPDALPERPM